MRARPGISRNVLRNMSSPHQTTPDAVAQRRRPPLVLVWLALGIVYVVWGATYLAMRVTVHEIPPFLAEAMRFATASAILATVLVARRGWRTLKIQVRQLASAALVGASLLAAGNGILMYAEQWVHSSIAALLFAFTPVFVVVLRMVTGDRPRLATGVGVVLGLGGIAILVLPGETGAVGPWHAFLVLFAAGCWAAGSFVAPRLPMPADAFTSSVYELAAGAAVLVVAGAAMGEFGRFHPTAVTGKAWLALAYLIVFGSLIAYTAFTWLLKHTSVTLVATYAYVNPAVAMVLGVLLLSEPVTLPVVLGGIVIIVAVAVVVTTERPPSDSRDAADLPTPAALDAGASPGGLNPGGSRVTRAEPPPSHQAELVVPGPAGGHLPTEPVEQRSVDGVEER